MMFVLSGHLKFYSEALVFLLYIGDYCVYAHSISTCVVLWLVNNQKYQVLAGVIMLEVLCHL